MPEALPCEGEVFPGRPCRHPTIQRRSDTGRPECAGCFTQRLRMTADAALRRRSPESKQPLPEDDFADLARPGALYAQHRYADRIAREEAKGHRLALVKKGDDD